MFRWGWTACLGLAACPSSTDSSEPEPPPPKPAAQRTEAKSPGSSREPDRPSASTASDSNPRAGTPSAETPKPAWPPDFLPLKEATADQVEDALRDLSVLVKAGASDPKNPWALLHGITAFGPDLKTSDGKDAVEVVMGYGQVRSAPDGPRVLFPSRTSDNRPLSPHANLVLKTFVQAGVDLDRAFEIKGQEFTLRGLLRGMEADFQQPTDAHAWARQAWTLHAWLDVHDRGDTWEGERFEASYSTLVAASLDALQRLQSFLVGPYRKNRPDQVEKRKQGIYAHTCGGLHFVQAVIRGVSEAKTSDHLKALQEQLNLVLFRYDAERVIYAEVMKAHPEAEMLLRVQQLKFFGHVLETFGQVAELELFELDSATQQKLRQVTHDLIETVYGLGEAYGNQERLKSRAPQTYYDLIGDGCHAVRGLRLARRHLFGDAS